MIELKNCKIGYSNKIIFENLDLNIEMNVITAILGINGSGKTTLVSTILGVQKLLDGNIKILGTDLKKLSTKELAKFIAVVPQLQKPMFDFKVFDIVLMGRNPHLTSSPSKLDIKKTEEVLKKVGIEHLAQKSYKQISGGERQMVNITRAINQDTPIIVMDEPTSYLDLQNQSKVMNLVKNLNEKENKTIIMVLHDPSHAMMFSQNCIFVEHGKVIYGLSKDLIIPEHIKRIYKVDSEKIEVDGNSYIVPLLINH
ncbi:MAG: ABC transporter ATP-binding protein [Fusobacteriaceae bacterium]